MEGGAGNETSQLASSPVASARNQDSVIASYKELIKEQVKTLNIIQFDSKKWVWLPEVNLYPLSFSSYF